MKFLKLLCFLLFLFSLNGISQGYKKYYSLGVDEGLTQNSIWDAFQDYKGYLWLASSDGINRYDGYQIKQYNYNPKDSNSIHGVSIYQFYEDKLKRLWVTHENGISLYNRKLDNFKHIYSYHSKPIVKGIIGEDNKNGIWAYIADEDFIIRINTKTLKVDKRLKVPNEKNEPVYFQFLAKIADQYFLEIFDDRILKIDLNNAKYEEIKVPIGKSRSFGVLDSTTLFRINGSQRLDYNIKTKKWTSTKLNPSVYKKDYYVFDYFYWNSEFYLGTVEGILIYNPKLNKITSHIKSFSENNQLGYTYIQKLRTDKSNNLWICTNGDGAKCLSPYRNKFIHFKSDFVKYNMIKSITTGSNGKVYCGTFDSGIIAFDNEGNLEKINVQFQDHKKVKSILALNSLYNNKLAFTHYKHLYILNTINNKVEKKVPLLTTCGFPNIKIIKNKTYVNDDENIYELTADYKLIQLIHLDKVFISSFDFIGEELWIGITNDLIIYDLKNKTSRKLNLNVFVKNIYKSRNEKIYISTINGLYITDKNAKNLLKFDRTNGLNSSFIYGVLEDKSGKIWLSNNKGLSVLNPKNNTIKNFDKNDGLQSNEFNTGAFYKDESGYLYFGGVNGINKIDPTNIIHNETSPNVSINKINVLDDTYKTDTSYNEIEEINLAYNQNTISFDFSALEFTEPNSNTYSYKLEGLDPEWINSGSKHFTRYTNLQAGNYNLKIKAANSDGVWSTNIKTIRINIKPPFWRTNIFYSVSGLLTLSIILSIFYFISYQQKLKLKRKLQIQKELENERIRISRDLHDNVGAQLSFLITNMEWIIENNETLTKEEEVKRLSKLTKSGREAIQTLRQTIWAISQNELSIEEFSDRFKQFALKLIEVNAIVNIQFIEDLKINTILSPATALNLFRICQESLNNCLKHAKATELKIIFESNNSNPFNIQIIDNGIGFENVETGNKYSYGIENMKSRAIESNAELSITSGLSKGTSVQIKLLNSL